MSGFIKYWERNKNWEENEVQYISVLFQTSSEKRVIQEIMLFTPKLQVIFFLRLCIWVDITWEGLHGIRNLSEVISLLFQTVWGKTLEIVPDYFEKITNSSMKVMCVYISMCDYWSRMVGRTIICVLIGIFFNIWHFSR